MNRTRLRKKVGKRPGSVFLSNEVFGVDIFVNLTTELCIETLDGNNTNYYHNIWLFCFNNYL